MSNEAEQGIVSLSAQECEQLLRDMAQSSAWAKAQLKRRRAAKNQKKSVYGIDDGIIKCHFSNYLLSICFSF